MKIVYAAGNSFTSSIQLSRFLKAISNKQYNIKIAAFQISSPKNIPIDWTLNSLLEINKTEQVPVSFNDTLSIYYDQIKSFNPDLIISDLEYFTSYIANLLNIPLWQYSSSIINFALTKKQKYNLGVFKHHAHLFHRSPLQVGRLINIIDNSNANLVYSHFGDISNPPDIENKFEWVRPYHKVGKISIPCQHNIIGTMCNKSIINKIKQYPDGVIFTDKINETYQNIIIKDINNEDEYFCNLQNSKLLVCEGQTSFLADAYYNNKPSMIYTNLLNTECVLNNIISNKLQLSHPDLNSSIKIKSTSNNIKYLHQKIDEFQERLK